MTARGLTLLEVMVALAIIVVLSAMALPAVWNRLGDGELNAAARHVESAVISARAQAQRDGQAVAIMARPGSRGVQLVAERISVEDGTGGFEAGESPAPGGWEVAIDGGRGAGRLLGRLPMGVRARAGQAAPAEAPDEERETGGVRRGMPQEAAVRIAVALPDGTMVARGPIRLSSGGRSVRIQINGFTGICRVTRERAAPGEMGGQEEWREAESELKEGRP